MKKDSHGQDPEKPAVSGKTGKDPLLKIMVYSTMFMFGLLAVVIGKSRHLQEEGVPALDAAVILLFALGAFLGWLGWHFVLKWDRDKRPPPDS